METLTLRSGAKANFRVLFVDIQLSMIYYVPSIALGDIAKIIFNPFTDMIHNTF